MPSKRDPDAALRKGIEIGLRLPKRRSVLSKINLNAGSTQTATYYKRTNGELRVLAFEKFGTSRHDVTRTGTLPVFEILMDRITGETTERGRSIHLDGMLYLDVNGMRYSWEHNDTEPTVTKLPKPARSYADVKRDTDRFFQ